MLRALRRRCAGPTLRILVIGVEGAEPTPSVHPGGEPEEPTGVQFPGLQHTATRRRSVSGTAAAGTDSARHAALRAAKKSSGVRAVQSVMSAAGFAWFPDGRAGRRARCPPVPQATARSAGMGACGDTGTRQLCRPWKRRRPGGQHLPRKPSREAAGQPTGGHACCQGPRRLPGRGRRRGAFRTMRGRDGALRIGSATRTRKSSSVSGAG